jgi:ABC-type transporter Mla subunit MlaD
MSEQALRAAIEEIRAELANAAGLTESNRESLRRLAAELEARLKQPGSRAENEALREDLTDWVRKLEASHPKLSSTIGQVVDTLAFFNL